MRHFDAAAGRTAGTSRIVAASDGAEIRQVVAIDRRDDGVLQLHRGNRAGDPRRLVLVGRMRRPMDDIAVAARAGADAAENHERGGAVVPALADVRAVRLFADRVEVERPRDLLEPEVAGRPGARTLSHSGFGTRGAASAERARRPRMKVTGAPEFTAL